MSPPLQYYPGFLPGAEASALMESLIQNTPWEQREYHLYGRKVKQPRLVAWYGESEYSYRYSGIEHETHPWTKELSALRDKIQAHLSKDLEARFNGVLLNYYRDGLDSVSWHSDSEVELGPDPLIASLSLGDEREFQFKHKRENRRHKIILEHGALLVMLRTSQTDWLHQIPKIKNRPAGARVNLTFRNLIA